MDRKLITAAVVLLASMARGEAPRLPYIAEVDAGPPWQMEIDLPAGCVLGISVRVDRPSALPPNGRLRASWEAPAGATGWRKVLHAFDADVYLVYRAAAAGRYRFRLAPVVDEEVPPFEFESDPGFAARANPWPAHTPWPDGLRVRARVELRSIAAVRQSGLVLETEPNDSAAQAVELPLEPGDGDQVVTVVGGADDADYFNNQGFGKGAGQDWYRVRHDGTREKLLTLNLQLVDPQVAGRIAFYRAREGNAEPELEYEGKDPNERTHQQDDLHRTFITRVLKPGVEYLVRVEANQPGYELEARVIDPAPYTDPARAIERAMYYQLAEVSAWMIHRPRSIAAYQRVRDGGGLFGGACMSCHAQSGVWGVAEAGRLGYPIEPGVTMSWRHLRQYMYESVRPTNTLADAGVNTSTQPADLGDGLAGTRVAGQNIVLAETFVPPRALQRHQLIRTANYVLQTDDPGGINAAGRGANYGPNVVYKFAGEILRRAWNETRDPRYLRGLEEKARKILDPANEKRDNAVTDDLGHRLEFVHRIWPAGYLDEARRLASDERYAGKRRPDEAIAEAEKLDAELRARAGADVERLLALQLADGSWSFDLGKRGARDRGWEHIRDEPGAAAPTAVALVGLHFAGLTLEHPAMRRGVQALLARQAPQGLWKEGETGFVTTAYAIRALAHLHPRAKAGVGLNELNERSGPEPASDTGPRSPLDDLCEARRLAIAGDASGADRLAALAGHELPQVRAYALVGLGAALAPGGLEAALERIEDPVKQVREAAHWALRQFLIDDRGWEELFAAYDRGSDAGRVSLLSALRMRVDLVGSASRVDLPRLAGLFGRALSDPHPAARAAGRRAARLFWIWNPPLRERIGRAWAEAIFRPEPDALGEVALRYSTCSFQEVNAFAGSSRYPELDAYYRLVYAALDKAELAGGVEREAAERAERRLAAVAATFHRQRRFQGPTQLSFSAKSDSGKEMAAAVVRVLSRAKASADVLWQKVAIDAAAGISDEDLQERVTAELLHGPEDLAERAALALANPSAVRFAATPERADALAARLRGFLSQGQRMAAESLGAMLGRVRWERPAGQPGREERRFFQALVPLGARGEALAAPAEALAVEMSDLLGKAVAANPDLHRSAVFDFVPASPPAGRLGSFWLHNLEWMLSHVASEDELAGRMPAGAVEAETLRVLSLSAGRTEPGSVPEGLASEDQVLWWRDARPDARLVLGLTAKEAGRYGIVAGFLMDRDHATVEARVNGQPAGEPRDFYSPFLTAIGPVSLGTHDLPAGESRLELHITGANGQAAPSHIVGLDYLAWQMEEGKDPAGGGRRRVFDPLAPARQALVRLHTAALEETAPAEMRELALKASSQASVRANPEIRLALAGAIARLKDPRARRTLEESLEKDEARFEKDLRAALSAERATEGGNPHRSVSLADVRRFRDIVWVELNRVNREDERSCLSCHGVPGRVPPFTLEPPDPSGYIEPAKLLANLRKLEARVDIERPERSKVLLKVRNSTQEGHQGGARYAPEDPGYKVLADWAREQAARWREVDGGRVRPPPRRF